MPVDPDHRLHLGAGSAAKTARSTRDQRDPFQPESERLAWEPSSSDLAAALKIKSPSFAPVA